MTPAQLATLKADILANPNVNTIPRNPDGFVSIAAWYNQTAAPDFVVWRTDVPVEDIQNAIVYANMTPAQAIPAGPTNDILAWQSRALAAQGKQFNLQNLLLGRTTVNASRTNIRAAFQDCLTGLPTKADGTTQAAGWAAVQTAMQRLATNGEKLYATGDGAGGAPDTMTFEGAVQGQDVEAALALP